MKAKKFDKLYYDGPIFPEPFQPPERYQLNGEYLPDLAMEMMWKAARFIASDYEKEAFMPNNNMWQCLKPELTPGQQKLKWPVDFIPTLTTMKMQQEAIKEEKKKLTKEEKLAIKAQKDALKAKHGTVLLNDKEVKISNYVIEDAGWILTRGKDPRKFCWKYLAKPEDITVNIVGYPEPKWAFKTANEDSGLWVVKYKVKCGHDKMACYKELTKVIAFHEETGLRQNMISNKFDKTQDILGNWSFIQQKVHDDCLKSNKEALIVYLIQNTGIRIGNERDENTQALTYGMQTLEKRHMILTAPNKVAFDFLGKDSVPDKRTIEIDPDIWQKLNDVYSKATVEIFGKNLDVNKYLKSIMPGISVKNLRTVVCNEVLVANLKTKTVNKNSTEAEKLRAMFEANLEIAKTMNHQKNVGKNQREGEQKAAERVNKAKERLNNLELKHKVEVKKLNEKKAKVKELYGNMPKTLKEKMNELNEKKAKLDIRLEKAKLSIEKTEFNFDKKVKTADIALGTSLANYCDFRIIKSWCDEMELPIEKIFTPAKLNNIRAIIENVPAGFWRTYPS